jgi:hypothetical protein
MTRQPIQTYARDIGTDYGSKVLMIPGTNGPDPREGGIPGCVISGLTNLGNASYSNPFWFGDTEYTLSPNLSWVK